MNIHTVATQASKHSKRTNKAEAFNVLLDLIEQEKIDDINASILYSFFTPALPAKPKSREQWVQKAVGNKDTREYLNFVYSDGNNICATNGHLLHTSQTSLSEGFYDKNMVKVKSSYTYPDFNSLIDGMKGGDIVSLTGATIVHHAKQDNYVIPYTSGEYGYSKQYVDKVLSMGGRYEITRKTENDPIVFMFDDGRIAIIMPILVK